MGKIALVLLMVVPILAVSPAMGKGMPRTGDGSWDEAKRGFEEILDLWREGKFAELYERTSGGKETKESFSAKLSTAPLKPACCWEKMQDVTVSPKGPNSVEIKARLGFEGGGGTEFKTRSFRLGKESGVWRIPRSDILSLASVKKKGPHNKKL